MTTIELFNKNPEEIDRLHQWIQDNKPANYYYGYSGVNVVIKKSLGGKIIEVEFAWTGLGRNDVTFMGVYNDGKTWCHFGYSPWRESEIEDVLLKPYIRNQKLEDLL
jgi:hypothetical protein